MKVSICSEAQRQYEGFWVLTMKVRRSSGQWPGSRASLVL